MSEDSKTLLEEKTIPCDSAFDTLDGKPLFAHLKRYRVPYKGKSLFSGMMMYGDNVWAVDFVLEDGTSVHEGGWCWHENNYGIWRDSVNEYLWKKRQFDDNSLLVPYMGAKKLLKALPPRDKHYVKLRNGQIAKVGDIVKVEFDYEGFCRMQEHRSHHVIYWASFYQNIDKYELRMQITHDRHLDVDLSIGMDTVIRNGVVVPADRKTYGGLGDFGRKMWRDMNGVKGSPKFS